MVPQARAFQALARLAQEGPFVARARLGPEVSPAGVDKALRHLRAALEQDARPDVALAIVRARIQTMPADDPDRHAALLTLLLARGEARSHLALPFDEQAVAMLA